MLGSTKNKKLILFNQRSKANHWIVKSNCIEFNHQNSKLSHQQIRISKWQGKLLNHLQKFICQTRPMVKLVSKRTPPQKGIVYSPQWKFVVESKGLIAALPLTKSKGHCWITCRKFNLQMPNHQNKKLLKPSSGNSSRDDGTKAMMCYSKHPKLNKNDNKIKVICVDTHKDTIP